LAADGTLIEGLESRPLTIPDLRIFRSLAKRDSRGSVASVYNRGYFESLGICDDFVQENHCVSPWRFTVRGFHYQRPPFGQPKLIRVVRGRILDVNVDLRNGSPTYGQSAKAELAAGGWDQIYVPIGFAHCYATLSDDVEVVFKLGRGYKQSHAAGLVWNDPDLAVDWPFDATEARVLERDLAHPRLRDVGAVFSYPAES
jgi:dTDP-4-dehydrorhamnose 3,5-epimerase